MSGTSGPDVTPYNAPETSAGIGGLNLTTLLLDQDGDSFSDFGLLINGNHSGGVGIVF